jgi:glycosyltransferase involved in cell wall biosynthesis
MSPAGRLEPAVSWPRIALVTPVFNSGRYIEATIRSVLAQEYPNLDYFIVDGGSTDGTVDVIRQYEDKISGWISEPDNGMYDALNKGFARTSGEIMGWISATDMLQLGGLSVVGSVFSEFRQVEWITGRSTEYNEEGMTVLIDPIRRWSRYRFLAGANRHIQQESTYWRRSLWEKAGGCVDDSRRMVSDFELWARFFRYAKLYSVDALIGGFRLHPDSIGLQRAWECFEISEEIVDRELGASTGDWSLKLLRRITRAVKGVPKVQGLWQRAVLDSSRWLLYRIAGPDWPPVIKYRGHNWEFRKK